MAWIFTTAFEQRSKTSLTSRLMVVGSCACCPTRDVAAAKNASPASEENPGTGLKLERRLITHWHTVEHVARRRTGSVSLGAFRHITKRPRTENPCGHGRCQRPFGIIAGG